MVAQFGERNLVLVTGCPRSGTSLTAGILARLGAFCGDVCGPTKANRKGQFEHKRMKNIITKPYLRSIGADPLGQNPLPEYPLDIPNDNPFSNIPRVLEEDGWEGDRVGMNKEAKLSLLWPVVQDALPKAKWLIVRRDRDEIIQSCFRTSFMYKRRTRQDWMDWVLFHEERFKEILRNCDAREIWPCKILNGNFSELLDVCDWLGLPFQEDVVVDFCDLKLWHGNV